MNDFNLNRNLVEARLHALETPNTFHIVDDCGAAVFSSEGESTRAIEVTPSPHGGVSILFLRPSSWSLPNSKDPFRSSASGSTSATSLEDALEEIVDWSDWSADDWSAAYHERGERDKTEIDEYVENVSPSDAPYRVTSMELTVPAAPSIWRGITESGDPIYIRYRHGSLRVHVGGLRGDDGLIVEEETLGGSFDSVMTREELFDIEMTDVDFVFDIEEIEDMTTLPTPEERFEAAVKAAPDTQSVEDYEHAMRSVQKCIEDVYDRLDKRANDELGINNDSLTERIAAEQERKEGENPWADARADLAFLSFSLGFGAGAMFLRAITENDDEDIERFFDRVSRAKDGVGTARSREGVDDSVFRELYESLENLESSAEQVVNDS